MPRKPNYKFERMERDRAKAAKKAERLKLKQERAEQKKVELGGEIVLDGETAPADQAALADPAEQVPQAAQATGAQATGEE